MKKSYFAIGLVIFLAVFSLSTKKVFALSTFDNTVIDGFDKIGYDATSPGRKARWLDFTTSGISGATNLISVSFYLGSQSGATTGCNVNILRQDTGDPSGSATQDVFNTGWYTFDVSGWGWTYSTLGTKIISFDPGGYPGCQGTQWLGIGGSNATSSYPVIGTGNEGTATHYIAFTLNGSPPSPSPYAITFHAPDFVDNATSSDFRSWEVDVTAPSSTIDSFQVKYKQASSTVWQYSDIVYFGHLNTTIGSYICGATICPPGALIAQPIPFSKSVNLPSGGFYVAEAFLYNTTLGHASSTLATSTLLHFGVAPGTAILHPGTESQPNGGLPPGQLWDSSFCPDTAFSVVGADFGKGICQVFAFLLVPGQDSINNWVGTQGLLSTTPPFSYLYQLSSEIGNLSGTNATITPLTLTTGTGTPINITFDMFSVNTMNKYTDSNSRGVVRTLLKYVLYLMFVTMIIFEVRHLFGGQERQK